MKISLPSNSGRCVFNINTISTTQALRGDIELANSGLEYEEEPSNSILTASNILLDKEGLTSIHTDLENWIKLPLNSQRDIELTFCHNIAGEPGATLTLNVGKRDDLIAALNTCATVSYELNRHSGEFSFVVDQSCLSAFREGISAVLSSIK